MRVKEIGKKFPQFELGDKFNLTEGGIDKLWRCYIRNMSRSKDDKNEEERGNPLTTQLMWH